MGQLPGMWVPSNNRDTEVSWTSGSGAGWSLGTSLSLVPFPGASSPIKMEKEAIQRQADHCNDRKMASKRVQELSADLFFAIFVRVRVKTIFPPAISGFPHEGSAETPPSSVAAAGLQEGKQRGHTE